MSDTTFTIDEIAKATGRTIHGLGGISYGALELVVPLIGNKVLLFRDGDDESDHEVTLTTWDKVNQEHTAHFKRGETIDNGEPEGVYEVDQLYSNGYLLQSVARDFNFVLPYEKQDKWWIAAPGRVMEAINYANTH